MEKRLMRSTRNERSVSFSGEQVDLHSMLSQEIDRCLGRRAGQIPDSEIKILDRGGIMHRDLRISCQGQVSDLKKMISANSSSLHYLRH
ncbi:hypothetical protein RRG08_050207 [Elysia crispata]|uniref:Uncharacterized protein n=1 Tax=Elysia crispata TaxID=231223 RepID=A0AAE1DBZ1_9GAST|nr:hypothetical protein RRG08_050207 [Elysia crispata]